MIKFYLPFPPSVNGLYAGKVRRYKSKKYQAWIIKANKALDKQIIPSMLERCHAVYYLNHPDNRIRDAENYCKAVTDLIVDREILQGDDRRYLKSTKAEWNDIKGNLVEVCLIKI
jgi:hypothetical protein